MKRENVTLGEALVKRAFTARERENVNASVADTIWTNKTDMSITIITTNRVIQQIGRAHV